MLLFRVLAVVTIPMAVGIGLGMALRHRRSHPFRGLVALGMALALPTLVAIGTCAMLPLVGLWDAAGLGLCLGLGIALASHRLFEDSRNAALALGSLLLTLGGIEILTRIFLPPPPAYPLGGEGPHFLLANVLRTIGPDSPTFHHGAVPYLLERLAMQADPMAGTMTERPPSAMLTREIVCSIAYGAAYSGIVDASYELRQVFPDQPPGKRPGETARVLHVGDSMVYGANVERQQTFTVALEALQPSVRHVNGGISGMAPDDYFVVLRKWSQRDRFDLALMYLFAGNDMVGMDSPHPCSNWQPILTYENGRANERFPDAPRNEPRLGLRWLLIHSPLPYVLRVAIVSNSAVAAYAGALFDSWVAQATPADHETPYRHLEAILATTRDDLARGGTRFAVIVLPAAGDIDIPDGPSASLSRNVQAISARLGIPMLDATEVVRASLQRGEDPVQADRVHFTPQGHQLVARWLAGQLAPLLTTERQGMP